MNDSVVELHNLRPGLTIGEDIYVNTHFPIVKKDTDLTIEHIEVLRVFNVKKVKVIELNRVNSVQIEVENSRHEELNAQNLVSNEGHVPIPLQTSYLEAVNKFKKEYVKWKAGTKLDIANVRAFIVPLLKQIDGSETNLIFLSDFFDTNDYLYHHSIAVGLIAFSIGRKLNFSLGESLQLGLAGTLIDSGMAKIESSINVKSTVLSEMEYSEVKKHPIYSYQMVKDSPLIRTEMKLAILQHHERLDGSGYPRGDKQKNVLLHSQILALADVYHAMTSDRYYRSKESPFKVLQFLREEEFGKFDINLIDTLYHVIGKLSLGTEVKLSNGIKGVVIFIHQDAPFRPIVKLYDNESTLDLTKQRDITINTIF
ncbi:HD-GYP domain-containing protein [Sporosarcina pasteurii]|uniref:Cyclic di-GMP phosphodiesterase response regulator RpfG n=1 Tax=Sporosarcina pasteurii TaxID=1474 RepID=A0A380BC88_SPOPA|nr:HD-GYP domain-containing protein [Sporosarcina pasteurii]MDS9471823.1 HD-GYP domain-containing protein [Sporosarcina pasteurii]QBQ06562.1 HD-GYP domain-containing protein [Sporosarcina pasteurii]SUI98022.1 Cyclic di-GMP phosphodiesterase response regulator RpfG [Sporosarcina pasteurii]